MMMIESMNDLRELIVESKKVIECVIMPESTYIKQIVSLRTINLYFSHLQNDQKFKM